MLAAKTQARVFAVPGRARRGGQQRVVSQRVAVRARAGGQTAALAAAAVAAAARARPRTRQVLPAGVRGARRPAAGGVPGRLLRAAAVRTAAALRVPRAAAAALLGRVPGAARARPLGARQARPLRRRPAAQRPAHRARRVQPLHEQGPRDPLAGVLAERAAAAAGGGEAAQVPQPAQQDARARAPLRLPRRGLRPPLLALRRAHAAHPHPHRAEAVPVSHLHAFLQPLRPPHDARANAHGREALRVRGVRPQVRALRREEAARQGAPQAAHEARARRRITPARAALAYTFRGGAAWGPAGALARTLASPGALATADASPRALARPHAAAGAFT